MPKFSFIIGVYNQKDTLPLLIKALRAQTVKDFEVHFCDDGSDDGTEQVITDALYHKNGADPLGFEAYYHRQEHKGMRLARSLNMGIKAARGEQCVFIMGDSFPEVDYLETLNHYASHNRILCGIRIQLARNAKGELEGVDMDWRVKKNIIPAFATVLIDQPWSQMTGNGLTIPTLALRRYGGWDESLEGYGGDDNEVISRLFFKGYVCWSVPDLRLYHAWHKAAPYDAKKNALVIKKMTAYAR